MSLTWVAEAGSSSSFNSQSLAVRGRGNGSLQRAEWGSYGVEEQPRPQLSDCTPQCYGHHHGSPQSSLQERRNCDRRRQNQGYRPLFRNSPPILCFGRPHYWPSFSNLATWSLSFSLNLPVELLDFSVHFMEWYFDLSIVVWDLDCPWKQGSLTRMSTLLSSLRGA